MSKLYFEDLMYKRTDYPKENPLADFGRHTDAHANLQASPNTPEDVTINPEFGAPPSILPYQMQDDYNRNKTMAPLPVAILENENIKATFIPSLGGRLWSLFDKKANKELLHVNPVFQPANLAIRNAWFSGGIEWNLGIIGHTPFTCSPLFTEVVEDKQFGPILRMYEYERIRKSVYQMDFFLPKDSSFLFARFTIYNTQDKDIPMYWWTNMAVNQAKDIRIIAPADSAIQFDYNGLDFISVPVLKGIDSSYTTNVGHAMDLFYYIKKGDRPFITALGGDGKGFVQTSTDLLKGRKLFLWGMGKGGKRWQEYLAAPGYEYSEIQAGLGRSQMEYLTMPANSTYEWLEAFGPLSADSKKVHGDWNEAGIEASNQLENSLPRSKVDDIFNQTESFARSSGKLKSQGSGWGNLENHLRKSEGKNSLPAHLNFNSANIENAQSPWLDLLNKNQFGISNPIPKPEGYEIDPIWRKLLEQSVLNKDKENAAAWLHLAIMRYNDREIEQARLAYEKSVSICPSAWALRGLAGIALYHDDDIDKGITLYKEACLMAPDEKALANEFGNVAAEYIKPEMFLDILPFLSENITKDPRIQLICAKCFIDLDRLEEANEILFSGLEIPDIREGETTLSNLWYRIKEKELIKNEGAVPGKELSERVRRDFNPPKELDFRMT